MQLQSRNYTPEEYLKLEAEAEYKSEYRDGEIIPVTGGTTLLDRYLTPLNYQDLLPLGCVK